MIIISSPCTKITALWYIKVCSQARHEAKESIQSDGFLLHRSLSEPDAWRTCEVWFPMSSGTAGAQSAACVCVCVCPSVCFMCACTHAYARLTSLQMSSGRAKCPLDDTLPVRVCLRTHLATIIRSNGGQSQEQRHTRQKRCSGAGLWKAFCKYCCSSVKKHGELIVNTFSYSSEHEFYRMKS